MNLTANLTTMLAPTRMARKECPMVFKPGLHISTLIIAFLIIFANMLVIYLFIRYRSLRKNVANLLLLSLSINDLVTGLAVIMHVFPFYYLLTSGCSSMINNLGVSYLAATDVFINTLTIVSVLHLVLLSSERFVSIYYALRYSAIVTRKRIVILAILAWVIGTSISLTQLIWIVPFVSNANRINYRSVVRNNKIFRITTTILFAFIPVIVLMFQYIWLFCLIRKLIRKDTTSQLKSQLRRRSLRELKALVIYCILFVCFVIFCCPYLLVKLLIVLNRSFIMKCPPELFETLVVLRFIVSLINPIVYALYKRDFKKVISNRTCLFPKAMLKSGRPLTFRSSEYNDSTNYAVSLTVRKISGCYLPVRIDETAA